MILRFFVFISDKDASQMDEVPSSTSITTNHNMCSKLWVGMRENDGEKRYTDTHSIQRHVCERPARLDTACQTQIRSLCTAMHTKYMKEPLQHTRQVKNDNKRKKHETNNEHMIRPHTIVFRLWEALSERCSLLITILYFKFTYNLWKSSMASSQTDSIYKCIT